MITWGRLRKAVQFDLFGGQKEEPEQLSLVQNREAKIGEIKQFGPNDHRILLMTPSGKARWMDETELDQVVAQHQLNQKEHEDYSKRMRSQAIAPLIPYAKYTQQDVFDNSVIHDPQNMQLGDLYFAKEHQPPQHLINEHKKYMERHQQHVDAAKDEERLAREMEAAREVLRKKSSAFDAEHKQATPEERLRDIREAIAALAKHGIVMKDLGQKYRLSGKVNTAQNRNAIERIPGKRYDPYTHTYTIPKERLHMLPVLFKSRGLAAFFGPLKKGSNQESLFDAENYQSGSKPRHAGTTGVRWPWQKGHIGEIRDFGPHDKRQLQQTSNGIMRWVSIDSELPAAHSEKDKPQMGIDFEGSHAAPHDENEAKQTEDNKKEGHDAGLAAKAKELGLRYEGPQRNKAGKVVFHHITDLQNMGTFSVKPGENIEDRLRHHRAQFVKSLHGILSRLFKSRASRSDERQLEMFKDFIPTGTIKHFGGGSDLRVLEPAPTNPMVRRWKDVEGSSAVSTTNGGNSVPTSDEPRPHTRGPAIKFDLRSQHKSKNTPAKGKEVWQMKKADYLKDKPPSLIKAADETKLRRTSGVKSLTVSKDMEGHQTIIPADQNGSFSEDEQNRIIDALKEQGLGITLDTATNTMIPTKFQPGKGFTVVPGDIHELVHKNAVKNAWLRGASIPDEVLNDYPEYAGTRPEPEPSPTTEPSEADDNIFDLRRPQHIEILRKINEKMPDGAEILPDPDNGLPFRSDYHVLRQLLRDMGYKFEAARFSGGDEADENGVAEVKFKKSLADIFRQMFMRTK